MSWRQGFPQNYRFSIPIYDVGWLVDELRLATTAVLLGGLIVSATAYLDNSFPDLRSIFDKYSPETRGGLRVIEGPPRLQRLIMSITGPPQTGRQGPTCPPQTSRYDSTRRTVINDIEVYIFAWPSKGGAIILEHAEAVDFHFLGLDPLNPPSKRCDSQSDEDEFCQRLLLLGAKWWDSEKRWQFLKAADELDEVAIDALEDEREPAPTMRERRWVSVGWPDGGGMWVAEFDTNLWGIEEEHNIVPEDAARLRLARTMDERCRVLEEHFKGRFYADPRQYQGHAFINSWATKTTGEVGPLVK